MRFFPFFDPEFLNRILERLFNDFESRAVDSESGFFLNDKFNLFSSITTLSLTGPLGFVFWSMIIGLFFRYLNKLNTLFKCFLLIHMLNVCLMFFTAWEFYKIKLVFVLLVAFFVSRYIGFKRVQIHNNRHGFYVLS